MKTANIMYWVNIVFAIVSSTLGSWIQATVFLAIASMFMCTELIIKEIHNGKRKTGESNSPSSVVETS